MKKITVIMLSVLMVLLFTVSVQCGHYGYGHGPRHSPGYKDHSRHDRHIYKEI
ncbi:MAG: hypothetical protein GY950_30245, partial [bacterium]|nr:hypothetical protein [bacterium]